MDEDGVVRILNCIKFKTPRLQVRVL